MEKRIEDVGVNDFIKAGLSLEDAMDFERQLRVAVERGVKRQDLWRYITDRKLLKPWHPQSVHQLVFYAVYRDYDESVYGLPPYWFPALLLGESYKDPITSFKLFQKFSVDHPDGSGSS